MEACIRGTGPGHSSPRPVIGTILLTCKSVVWRRYTSSNLADSEYPQTSRRPNPEALAYGHVSRTHMAEDGHMSPNHLTQLPKY